MRARWELGLDLGRLAITPAAAAALQRHRLSALPLLARHCAGDWGDVATHDWAANDHAVEVGARVLSAYRLPDGAPLWIITEGDRSVTTILTPDDY